jgi:hypothetical protein
MVAATTAAMARKLRMVCHSSQRDWIERQSPGRVATVQSWIWLSIGTSTARVMTRAATMSRNPAAIHQNAADRPPGHSRARVTRALSRARGSRMAIGRPRLRIISWPTARKVSADSRLMVRLRANQVPQNTPMTRAKRTMVVAWAVRILMACSSVGRFRSQAAGQGGQQVRPVVVVVVGAEPDQDHVAAGGDVDELAVVALGPEVVGVAAGSGPPVVLEPGRGVGPGVGPAWPLRPAWSSSSPDRRLSRLQAPSASMPSGPQSRSER